jgi:hypothetical protein
VEALQERTLLVVAALDGGKLVRSLGHEVPTKALVPLLLGDLLGLLDTHQGVGLVGGHLGDEGGGGRVASGGGLGDGRLHDIIVAVVAIGIEVAVVTVVGVVFLGDRGLQRLDGRLLLGHLVLQRLDVGDNLGVEVVLADDGVVFVLRHGIVLLVVLVVKRMCFVVVAGVLVLGRLEQNGLRHGIVTGRDKRHHGEIEFGQSCLGLVLGHQLFPAFEVRRGSFHATVGPVPSRSHALRPFITSPFDMAKDSASSTDSNSWLSLPLRSTTHGRLPRASAL